MDVWRESKSPTLRGGIQIHAVDTIEKRDALMLSIEHVVTDRGRGFRPKVEREGPVGFVLTIENLRGTDDVIYQKALTAGRRILESESQDLKTKLGK